MTDFTEFVRYFCHVCSEECINHQDEARTEASECASCFSMPDLRQAPSAGTGAEGSPSEQRERGTGPRVSRAARTGATSRKRGPAPDPEAGAQGPTGREDPTTPRGKPEWRLNGRNTDGGGDS